MGNSCIKPVTEVTMSSKLKQGYWKMGKEQGVGIAEGERMTIKNFVSFDYPDIPGKWHFDLEFGDFGEARKELAEAAEGVTNLNVHLKSDFFSFKGIINDEGSQIMSWEAELITWNHIPEEELKRLMEDRTPYHAPSCPYVKEMPDKPGKIFWLSGPPGAGKSTTGQMMARGGNYTYYEGDSVMQLLNPFVDLEAEDPTKAAFRSKPLKEVPREDAELILDMASKAESLFTTMNFDEFDAMLRPLFKVLNKHLTQQKLRLGGNFVVAHAVPSRDTRNYIREGLGSLGQDQVVFIVLNMSLEASRKRVLARHGDGIDGLLTFVEGIHKLYEPAGEDEANTFNVDIEDGMSKDEVLAKVMEVVKRFD